MRPLLLLTVLALSAPVAPAQIARTAPAFVPALSPWIGVTSFGNRQSFASREASYRGSLTIGVRGDLPLTRRLGLLGTVSLSPLAKQRTEDPFGTQLHDDVTIVRADAALGWRFIPRAPVFFFGGGGILAATNPAFPQFDESVVEPRGLFGLGYDRASTGRLNFRVVATGFITAPADPDPGSYVGAGEVPVLVTKSTTFDWALELGARYTFSRGR
ncbi:MAG TPA: hypothetical protein VK922_18710 [Gemmatimonadaceae bacterium]|nr:hypothetical protein [Gemmatimonadaceae bacterium]